MTENLILLQAECIVLVSESKKERKVAITWRKRGWVLGNEGRRVRMVAPYIET